VRPYAIFDRRNLTNPINLVNPTNLVNPIFRVTSRHFISSITCLR
jgi:hypothetical protein